MADVHFELAGDAIVQVAITEMDGGTLLCDLTLPRPFVGVNAISLSIENDRFLVRTSAPLPTVKLDAAAPDDLVVSFILALPDAALSLKDVIGQTFKLDAIDANDRVWEAQGQLPDQIALVDQGIDDELLFTRQDDPSCQSGYYHEIGRNSASSSGFAHRQIAEKASAGIAQLYDDEFDDMFIMRPSSDIR